MAMEGPEPTILPESSDSSDYEYEYDETHTEVAHPAPEIPISFLTPLALVDILRESRSNIMQWSSSPSETQIGCIEQFPSRSS